MHLKPAITFEQYVSDMRDVRSRRAKRKPNQFRAVAWGMVIGLALVGLYDIPATRVSSYVLGAGFLLLAAAWNPYVRRRQKSLLRGVYDDQQAILNGNEMDVDESGISGSWVKGHARYEFGWTAFSDCIDRPDAFLFLYSPCCWIRVQKDGLLSADQLQIIAWYNASRGTTDTPQAV